MAKVFVSYARVDRERADQLYQWLVAEGHEVFLDEDLRHGIAVGEGWEQRSHERLRWADAVVYLVTSASVASSWCTAEISIALSRGSRVLPVRAEPKAAHPLLKSAQYADLTVDPTKARAALAEALRRIDAAGGFGWPDEWHRFQGCARLTLNSIGCFSVGVRRPRSLPSCCDRPLSGTGWRCWWWALRGAVSPRWCGPG